MRIESHYKCDGPGCEATVKTDDRRDSDTWAIVTCPVEKGETRTFDYCSVACAINGLSVEQVRQHVSPRKVEGPEPVADLSGRVQNLERVVKEFGHWAEPVTRSVQGCMDDPTEMSRLRECLLKLQQEIMWMERRIW